MNSADQIHCDWCNGKLDWGKVVDKLRGEGARAMSHYLEWDEAKYGPIPTPEELVENWERS